jgi:hypothetical protein
MGVRGDESSGCDWIRGFDGSHDNHMLLDMMTTNDYNAVI